jgi:hypothetical protein
VEWLSGVARRRQFAHAAWSLPSEHFRRLIGHGNGGGAQLRPPGLLSSLRFRGCFVGAAVRAGHPSLRPRLLRERRFLLRELLALEHHPRCLPHHDGSVGGGEHGNKGDFRVRSFERPPRNPNAVGSAQVGGTVVGGKLLGGEGVLAIGLFHSAQRIAAPQFFERVVVGVNQELPFHWNRVAGIIVEIDSSAEASGGGTPQRGHCGGGPKRGHASWLAVFALLQLRLGIGPGHFRRQIPGRAARRSQRHPCQQQRSNDPCMPNVRPSAILAAIHDEHL